VFDHVTLRTTDHAASERFYDTVLATLGLQRTADSAWQDFRLAPADAEHPATRGLHIGFVSPSREHVDRFWQAGITAGYRSDGEPGPRPQYAPDYYGAFLLDPDGNSAEAVHLGDLRQGGIVDHLWIRVADLAAARAFYETIAPRAGFRLNADRRDRAQFIGDSGSFSVVAGGDRSRHVHMAFPAADGAATDRVRDPDGNTVEILSA
jgi:catechol 2,3-dioxygenase-like lactoylglutathione lyase family enzyme